MNEIAPTYSIITTCKGRLGDLKQSLPRFLAQKDAEVLVTDYDCPEDTAGFLAQHFPAARVVKVEDRQLFNAAEARNAAARQARGEVLVFLDADVLVGEDFLAGLGFRRGAPVFGVFSSNRGDSLRGSCVIHRAHFEALGGYDELLGGYEGEDLDIYMRLRVMGLRPKLLADTAVIEVIQQSEEERLRFRRPNIPKQFLRGQLYQLTKEMVLRSQCRIRLDLSERKALIAEVDRQLDGVFSGEHEFGLTVDFKDRYKRVLLSDWEFSTSIGVTARRKSKS